MKFSSMTLCLILILGINISQRSYSLNLQNINHIESNAKAFLTKEIIKQHKTVDPKSIEITILNSNPLNNKVCNNKVAYHFPIYSNLNKKTTIIAECSAANNSWKIYLPVKIKFLADVVSVKKSLPKMHIINKEDLIHKKINVINLKAPYFADSNEVVGLTLKNSVKQDTVLTSNLLEKATHGA